MFPPFDLRYPDIAEIVSRVEKTKYNTTDAITKKPSKVSSFLESIFGALQKIRGDKESKMKVRNIINGIDWKMDEMQLDKNVIEMDFEKWLTSKKRVRIDDH